MNQREPMMSKKLLLGYHILTNIILGGYSMTKRHIVCALCAITILSLLAACGPVSGPTMDTPERHPFRLDIVGEDGTFVSWESYTEGFLPGTRETMHLAAKNNTDQTWNGRLCVQLLEPQPSTEVIPLTEQEFELESGGGFERDVDVDLPADLSSGTYGLALVVHQPTGPVVDVIPVQVGEGEQEPFQGEWPTEAALEICPPPAGVATDPAAPLVALAKADLAERLNVGPDEIAVQSVEPTEFPDASLGVPEQGKVYAQVITPGYVIRLVVNSTVYEYHGSGDRVVFVPDEPQAPAEEAGYGMAQLLVELAIADLTERLAVGPDEIAVQSVEPTEFPDASLGIPEQGKVYAQVITPGYVIRLVVDDAVYEYHGSGDRVVFVPTSSPPVYQEMNIPEAGLEFEVPASWMRLEAEWAWSPDGANSLRLGVNWMDIQPPQEVEAAMLPTPSQIIHSEPVELDWGSGRRFTVEVYAPAAQGGDTQAPVQSVETHVLIVVSLGDARRAFDFYASDQTAEQLAILEPSLQHVLTTSALTN